MAGTGVAQAWNPIGDIGRAIFGLIINLMLEIAGWFIKLTFWILKFVIEVGGYNGYIDSPAVTVGWVMVRDVTNMFFVVVLLIISFGTILGLEQYEYKKLLVKLLMAAVVVNFSRIICGIIIDVAQVVMITFINGVAATGDGNLLAMFKMDGIWKLTGAAQKPGSGETFLAAVAAITFASIMMVTMLTYLFLLLARMVILWILIVLSPFAFVLNVLPQTQKYAGQWWTEFGGNVVAGPIIAFFLWLSFVTVGAGNAHDHLSSNSATAIKEGVDPQETSTGLTEVMSWANMANFAIAIGMLLAGAKMAQQLGAAGGSMMGKAREFGTKVAMIASGANAARWAGRGIAKGAKATGKFAAMNVPLVGGKSWQRRGRKIAAKASFAWAGLSERRNEAAVKLEKEGKDLAALEAKKKAGTLTEEDQTKLDELKGKGTGFFGRGGRVLRRMAKKVAVSGIESQGREEKRVKDWERAAENQKKLVEETYSVSGEKGGITKTNSAVRLQMIEALASAKKSEKETKEEGRIRSRVGMLGLQEKLDNPKTTDEEKAVISSQLEEAKKDYASKFNEKFEANADDRFARARMDKAGESGAKGELVLRDIAKEKELNIAEQKDKALVARGEGGKANFVAGVLAAHQKELEDQMNNLTYRELTKKSEILVNEMKKMQESGNTGSSQYRKVAADAAAALSANMKKGQDNAMQALDGGAKAAGFSEILKPGDHDGMQRKAMSALLGKNVSGTTGVDQNGQATLSLEDAVKEFKSVHGDKSDTILRQLNESFKKAAIDGSVDMAGLINDSDMDDNGKIKYRLTGRDEQGKGLSSPKEQKEEKDYREGMRSVLTKSINVSQLVSLGGGMTPSSDEGIKQMISAFSGMKRNTKLQQRLLDEMVGMISAKDESGKPTADALASKADFQAMFKKFLQEKPEAAKAMLGNLVGTFTDTIAEEGDEISKAVKEISRDNRGKKGAREEAEQEEEP